MAQLKTKFIADLAISTAKIAASAVTGAKIESSVALGGSPTTTTQSAGDNSTKIATTAYVKSEVDAAISGLDWQADVLDIQVDATLDPGASPTLGDRYLITNSAALHANFGTITGVGDDDIVQFDGADFVVSYDVSVQGEGALVWDQDSNTFQRYDGADWAEFGGLSGITAGDGLSKSGSTISVNVDDSSIEIATDALQVKALGITNAMLAGSIADGKMAADYIQTSEVDGSSIEFNGGNLNVKALGITDAMLAGSISDGKLASDYIQTSEVDDSSIEFSGGSLNVKALGIAVGMIAADAVDKDKIAADVAGIGLGQNVDGSLEVNVDDSSIEVSTDTLQVKALGITNAMLAGSIADGKMAADYVQTSEVDDSSIEFNGGSLNVKALGITDAMLAGSISDGKLASDYVQTSEVDGATIKFTTQLEALKQSSEIITLDGTDITNQYVDLAQVCHSAGSISLVPVGGPEQLQGTDYTVSLTGGAGGVTRISFAGDLATAGDAALIATDKIIVKYSYL